MASDFLSNGWRACEENGIVDSGLIEFLQLKGSNGIVIGGLIAWIDLNLDCVACTSTPAATHCLSSIWIIV